MYEVSGFTVPRHFAGSFRHTLDTTEGQSGSPIWTVRGGLHILIGIVTSYDPTGQMAMFVKMVRNEIGRWMAEDAPRVQRRIALEVPYRWICRLEVYDNDLRREMGYGTGLLISDRHVLTSARVIYNFSRDRRRYSVRITPGYEFYKEAFGSMTASQARVSPGAAPRKRDLSIHRERCSRLLGARRAVLRAFHFGSGLERQSCPHCGVLARVRRRRRVSQASGVLW
jgi:hypothetical protein